MGQIVACLGAGLGWCCCTASTSLITSCCGNDKASSIPPSVHSGRKRSVLLLVLSIGFSFLYQYWLGPALKESMISSVNPVYSYLAEAWSGGCLQYSSDGEDIYAACTGNSGVYRVAGFTLLFYILAAMAAFCKPTANREAWPAKYILWLIGVVGMVFIPNDPLFDPILLWIFRIGAVLFMIFNQLIILDLAFNLNENWVEKADKAELDEGEGAGKKWLGALLLSCAVMIIGSLVAIIFMFVYFTGCDSNNAFITITLIAGIALTLIQLFTSEEGSLFTSSCIFAYSTYLCYSAVTKNPSEQCNPVLGEESIGGILLGLLVTFISVMWTSYSHTAHRTVNEESDAIAEEAAETNDEEDNKPITGNVIEREGKKKKASENYGDMTDGEEENPKQTFASSWKLNIILAFITCWFAMALTSWGSVASGGDMANPQAGKVGMWMIMGSHFLQNLLYLWTLVAPKLLPDRDFN